jgi:isoleucyl-tRNA synthetase
VFLQEFPEVDDSRTDDALDARWGQLLDIRSEILKCLEVARKDKKIIGHSLDALVEVYASGKTLELLRTFEDQLDDICIVSEAVVIGEESPIPDDAVTAESVPDLTVRITKALGEKCPRCWHYRTTIGENSEHPDICARCAAAIS